ncbi:MAG TPA: hypothetical protein VGP07_22225 [Polyangia bacterium]|jgi:hypothetical protein
MSRARLVVPRIEGTIYRWSFGETTFEVDAAHGARVTRFSLGGDNILSGPEVNALNFGATFWTSPQSQWGWPPPVELDSEPYSATRLGDTALFSGRPDATLGIAVNKRVSVDGASGVVTLEYELRNLSGALRTVAPWEISRHPTHGLTFFPEHAPMTAPASSLAVTRAAGAVWFAYESPSITDHQKLFAHGAEGWICHVDVARRLQLVKRFPELARAEQAPGEASIEIYADPTHTYIEVEQQGAYRPLASGESVTWRVDWLLRRLPATTTLSMGSLGLLAAARALASA